MAVRTARLGREKTVSALAKNLFVLEGKNSAQQRRRAEDAILKANPDLDAKEKFITGKAVVVPVVPGLKLTARVEAGGADVDGLLLETGVRLKASAAVFNGGVTLAQKRSAEATARLGDAKFRKMAKAAVPGSVKLIDQSRKAAQQEQAKLEAQAAKFETALEQAMSQLADLSELAKKLPSSEG